MKKINLIMMSIFLGGILLIGVGAGVAFGEYSGLQYGGEKQIGTEETEEIVLEHEVAIGKDAKKTILSNWVDAECEVKEDKKVPEGTIQYIVEYNPEYISPYVGYTDYDSEEYVEEESKFYEGELYLSAHSRYNELNLFMKYKDEILSDLKKKVISSYEYHPWKKVTVKVNPKTMKYIEQRM